MAKDKGTKSKSSSDKDRKSIIEPIGMISLNDRYSTYPLKGLTPVKLATLLVEADSGDIARQAELFHEMLRKGGHLSSLSRRRTLQVTRKNYEITTPSTDKEDVRIASEAAAMIARVKKWKNFIGHLMDARLKGFVVIENIWKEVNGQIDFVDFKWLHQKKFRFGKASDKTSDLNEIRLLIDSVSVNQFRDFVPADMLRTAGTDGVALDFDPVFRKRFSVGVSNDLSGSPADSAVLRTIVYSFLFLNYDVKWWVQFGEKLLGYRIGKYDASEPDQKNLLKEIVQGLANDAAAVISKNSEIQFVEAIQKAASAASYAQLKDYFESDMTKAVLLHESANKSTPGKLGSEDVVGDTLQMLLESDGEFVDEIVNDDIIRPWVEMNYGEREYYPTYKTQVEQEGDLLAHADLIGKLQKIGKKISRKYVDQKFGIPSPDPNDPDDEALESVPETNPFLSAKSNLLIASRKKKLQSVR